MGPVGAAHIDFDLRYCAEHTLTICVLWIGPDSIYIGDSNT